MAWAIALLALTTFSANAQQMTISPATAQVGSLLTVSGSGFTANQNLGQVSVGGVLVTVDGHQLSVTTGSLSDDNISADANGSFTATFRAPVRPNGSQTLGLSGSTATAMYSVMPRIISYAPLSVQFGQSFTVSGDGFRANKNVVVKFGDYAQGELRANGSGQVNGSVAVKQAPFANGTTHPLHALTAVDKEDAAIMATRASSVGVDMIITNSGALNKKSGAPITLRGHGFPAQATLELVIGMGLAEERSIALTGAAVTVHANGSLHANGENKDQAFNLAESGATAHLSWGVRDLVLRVTSGTNVFTRTRASALGIVPSVALAGVNFRSGVNEPVVFTLGGFAHYTDENGVSTIQTNNTGTAREGIRIDLVQNGVVRATGVYQFDAMSDLSADTPPVNAADTGMVSNATAYNLTAADVVGLTSGLATVRATGLLSGASAETNFFYSSPADQPRVFVVTAPLNPAAKRDFKPGDTVHIVGTSFPQGAVGALNLVSSGGVTAAATLSGATIEADGSFAGSFSVASKIGGVWDLSFVDHASVDAEIHVIPGAVGISPTAAMIGDSLTVTGEGFLPNETVTFNVTATTSIQAAAGADGTALATVMLNDSPIGGHKLTASHSRGATDGNTLAVNPDVLRVNGFSRYNTDGTPKTDPEMIEKSVGDRLTIIGNGQSANTQLQLWLDFDGNGAVNAGDFRLDSYGSTNANGSYSVTGELDSVAASNLVLGNYYGVLIRDPGANNRVTDAEVMVAFRGSYLSPIATYDLSVVADGTINIRGEAFDATGTSQPGKNFGNVFIDNVPQLVFVEGSSDDLDASPGKFHLALPLPQLSRGDHQLTLGNQTVVFSVTHRVWLAAGGGNVKIGNAGTKVNARGFAAGETVQLRIGSAVVGSKAANANGTADGIAATIPILSKGSYNIDVVGVTSGVRVNNLTSVHVIPDITITPGHGTTETTVTVRGKGYRANEGLRFTFGGNVVTFDDIPTADAMGTFEKTFELPPASFMRDGIAFVVSGNISSPETPSGTASASFILGASMRLAEGQAFAISAGDTVTLSGDGFAANEVITLNVDGQGSTTLTTDATGAFTGDVAIPEAEGGIQTINASAGTSRQRARLTVNVGSSLEIHPAARGSRPVGGWQRVTVRGFQSGTTVRFFAERPDGSKIRDIPILGADTGAGRHRIGGNGSAGAGNALLRLVYPEIARGTWTLVAEQVGGAADPLTGSARQARTTFTIDSLVTHIKGQGNRNNWPVDITVATEDANMNPVRSAFAIRGTGFTAGASIKVSRAVPQLGGGYAEGDVFDVTSNTVGGNGTFTLRAVVIDTHADPGNVSLMVTDGRRGHTLVNAIRIVPTIYLSPNSGEAGEDTVEIRGYGFTPGTVTFRFSNDQNLFAGASSTSVTDRPGDNIEFSRFVFSGVLNAQAPIGWQTVTASDILNNTKTANLLVGSRDAGLILSLDRVDVKVGDEVTVTGTGYSANSSYPVSLDGVPAQVISGSAQVGRTVTNPNYIRTDENGSFRFKARIPNIQRGDRRQFRVGANHAISLVNVTEKAAVAPAPATAEDGMITVSGTGFSAGDTLVLRLRNTRTGYVSHFFTQDRTLHRGGGVGHPEVVPARVTLTNARVGNYVYTHAGDAGYGRGFIANDNGTFTVGLRVPAVPLGDYRVDVMRARTGGRASNSPVATARLAETSNTFRTRVSSQFFVNATTVYNRSTHVGGVNTGALTVTAKGFQANRSVTFSLPGWSQRVTADADGSVINETLTVTGAQFGNNIRFRAQGDTSGLPGDFPNYSLHRVDRTLSVGSEVVVVPNSATPGDRITFHVFGFDNDDSPYNRERVQISIGGPVSEGGIQVINASIGSNGQFGAAGQSYTIPQAFRSGNNLVGVPGGTVIAAARGHGTGGGGYAETALTIIPQARILNSSVVPGGDIQIQGYGFPAGATVRFYLDNSADGSGSYVLATARNNTANNRGGIERALVTAAEPVSGPHLPRHVRWEIPGGGGSAGAGSTTNTYALQPMITLTGLVTGRGGESIRVVGSGYAPGTYGATMGGISAGFTSAQTGTLIGGQIQPTIQGRFEGWLTAPNNVATGVTSLAIGSASANFIYSDPNGTRTLTVLGGGSGVPGTEVRLRGHNFGSLEPVGRLLFDSDSTFITPQILRNVSKIGSGAWQVFNQQVYADVNGVFEVKFNTPVDTLDSTNGVKYVKAENGAAVLASVSISSAIERTPRLVSPGSMIRIAGRGYAGGANLGKPHIVGIGDRNASNGTVDANGNIVTTSNGTFSAYITVPGKGSGGVYWRDAQLTLQGSNIHAQALQIRNTQEILSVSPESGGAGTLVRVKGRGFAANRKVAVRFDGKWVHPYNIVTGSVVHERWVTSSANGMVDFHFNVPPSDSGNRELWIRQFRHASDVNRDVDFTLTRRFNVNASIAVRPVSGNVGDRVTVTGTGFGRHANLRVNMGGADVGSFRANGDGSFNAEFMVPELSRGTQMVTVGGVSKPYSVGSTYSFAGAGSDGVVTIGETLEVVGMGLEAESALTVHLGNGQSRVAATGLNGTLRERFEVEDTPSHMAYRVTLEDAAGNVIDVGEDWEWHVQARATMGPSMGNPGDEAMVSGDGFSPFERIRVRFGGITAVDGHAIPVNENGTLDETTVRVPNLPPGRTTMRVEGLALNSRGAVFLAEMPYTVGDGGGALTVLNEAGASVSVGSPGERIRAYVPEVNTFTPGETVMVTFEGQPTQYQSAATNGTLPAVAFTISNLTAGGRMISAQGGSSGVSRMLDFTVVPRITRFTPETGQFDLGEEITITGVGAEPNSEIEVWLAPASGNNPNTDNVVSADEKMVMLDAGSTSNAQGLFNATFRVANRLFDHNPAHVRLRVQSGDYSSLWFGRAMALPNGAVGSLQAVARGVRVEMAATSGPGDATLMIDGVAASSIGINRLQENIGAVTVEHSAIGRSQVPHAALMVEEGGKVNGTIRTNLSGRFEVSFNLADLHGGRPLPSGTATIYIGAEEVSAYEVMPELRVYDASNGMDPMTDIVLGKSYILRGVSFEVARPVTLALDGAPLSVSVSTDSNGQFSTPLMWGVGELLGGPKMLTADTAVDMTELGLTVQGMITGVTAGMPVMVGYEAMVSGHGYGAEEALTAMVGGAAAEIVDGMTTNMDGTFSATIAIPMLPMGTHGLTVSSDTSEAMVSGAYMVESSLMVGGYTGTANVSSGLAVSGEGYGANQEVMIAVMDEDTLTVNANASGSFSATVPLTMERDHGAMVSLTVNGMPASFVYDAMAEASGIMVSPNPAGSGRMVTVSADIEMGSMASFNVEGVDGAMGDLTAMADEDAPDGFTAASGSFDIADGSDIEDAMVTLTVTDALGNETMHDAGMLTIDTVAPVGEASVSSDSVRNGETFTVTATSEETGLSAMVDVSGLDSTQPDAVALMESDEGGVYSAEVTLSRENAAEIGEKMITATLTDAAGNATAIELAIELGDHTSFTIALHAGMNMIHVPVDDEGIERASDLYNRINAGANIVSAVVSLNDDGRFVSYTGGAVGSAADRPIGDSSAVIVLMRQAAMVTFTGGALESTVTISPGANLVGIPRSGALAMVSELADLAPDAGLTTLALIRGDEGSTRFAVVTEVDDVAVTGGQGFIVIASSAADLTLSGELWSNEASSVASVDGAVPTSTPILVVEGSLAREDTLAALNGLEVSVTNVRTGQSASDKVGLLTGSGRFSATLADLQGGDYRASDEFEVRVLDPSGSFGGLPETRIVLSKDDAASGRVDLGQLLLSAVPDRSALLPNYPNPFNPETWIPFELSESSRVTVTIYNAAGQTVRVLELGDLPAGTYHSRAKAAYWDGRNALGEQVSSGLYFYRIEAGSFSALRRMAILK